jgi:hypothetical protein
MRMIGKGADGYAESHQPPTHTPSPLCVSACVRVEGWVIVVGLSCPSSFWG